jgi:hypothetical protein
LYRLPGYNQNQLYAASPTTPRIPPEIKNTSLHQALDPLLIFISPVTAGEPIDIEARR